MMKLMNEGPRLVYTRGPKQGEAVRIGDEVVVRDQAFIVDFFQPPHKPSASGRVTLVTATGKIKTHEFYVSVIGAEWINRTDQGE